MDDVQTLRRERGFPLAALSVCSRLSAFAQMREILREKAPELGALDKEERDHAVEYLMLDVTVALHGGGLEDEDSKALTDCIETLRPFVASEIMSGDPLRFIIEHSHGVEKVGRTLDALFKTLERDQLGALTILKHVVDYILSKDADSLERLHPEQRELALEMISKMSPDTHIPQEVLDSV